ncbi:MAG: hypothetical protein NVSMB27_05500 [Ktedonobacteraceae bacterium]
MLIGYARVSTQDQTLHLQKDALEKIGCSKIFTDTISGAKTDRPGLTEALEYVREGDSLVVWKMDRLGRSLKHLIETITALNNRKIGFKSLTEGLTPQHPEENLSFIFSEHSLSLNGILLKSEHKQDL